VFCIQLQISVMCNVVGFIQKVRHQLFGGSPRSGRVEQAHGKGTQHVTSHREMLWSHRIIIVVIMEVFRILEITFNNVSDLCVSLDAVEIKVSNFISIEKTKVTNRQRFALGGGIERVGIEVCDITTRLRVVVSLD